MKKKLVIAISVVLTLVMSLSIYAAPYANYTFNSDGDYFVEPPAMTPDVAYDYSYMIAGHPDELTLRDVPPSGAQAYKIDENGISFISDTGNNRILMLDANFKLLTVISEFEVPDASEDAAEGAILADAPKTLNKPIGIMIHRSKLGENKGKDLLYVCDSENHRILLFEYKADGTVKCIRQFGEPDGLMEVISARVTAAPATKETAAPAEGEEETEETEKPATGASVYEYVPLRVVVDDADRIYVLVKGVHQGIVELDVEGGFSQFIAPAKVTESNKDWFFKQIMTEEQKGFMQQASPPEYSNIAIDDDGFIYAVISTIHFTNVAAHINAGKDATDSGAPVRRLSLTGDDVLRRKGVNPPAGDIIVNKDNESEGADTASQDVYSRPIDIQPFNSGIYSILDSKRNKVFTYDTDGNLLFVFGITGKVFGSVSKASALQIMPDQERIALLDEEIGQIVIYKPTEYAKLIFEANRLQSELNFDEANAKWNELLSVSSNSEIAYVGKGKFEMNKGNYKEAMEYFRLGNDRENFSKALKEQRDLVIDRYLKWVLLGVGVLLVIWMGYALYKKYDNIGKEVK